MTRRAVLFVCLLLAAAPASAQEPYNFAVNVQRLSLLFTQLYGPQGLIVDSLTLLEGEEPHTGHFNSDFQAEFSQFSTALTSQLVSVPLPSPASGFTYEFDPGLGVFTRTTRSFGPILAERAETIGAGQTSFGFTYQHFGFDAIEGIDLSRVPAVFTHDNATAGTGRADVVTTTNEIRARVSQFTAFLTYGVTNHLDLSVAIPLVSNDLLVVSDASIQRIGTTDERTHFFRSAGDAIGSRRIFTAFGSASGLGDVTVRLKQTLTRRGAHGFAVGLDVRLPTGDEADLLGTGAPGLRPFGVWSASYGAVAPHANLGYLWNGSSVLAGDPAAGVSADLPDQVTYVTGAEITVNPRVTVAFDLIGRYVIDTPRLVAQTFTALDGVSRFPNIVFRNDSHNETSGAVGFKLNLVQRLLVDVNVLFKLNDNGLRDKVTPLLGLEYTF